MRRLVAEILESNGYTVLQAGDGPSALELLRRHTGPLDLLVTDVVMPGMSGPDVAGAVAAMRPGTQVLYISGYTDSSVGQHGVLEPGIAFLQKPFDADVLTRKVREVLDGVVVPVDYEAGTWFLRTRFSVDCGRRAAAAAPRERELPPLLHRPGGVARRRPDHADRAAADGRARTPRVRRRRWAR